MLMRPTKNRPATAKVKIESDVKSYRFHDFERKAAGQYVQVTSFQSHPLPPKELFKSFADAGYFQTLATVVGREDFEYLFLPVAEQAALRLQDLPLTQNAFAARGGALQCALRAGLMAVRLCEKTIFNPQATAAERMTGDQHFRWLSYCATLATVYLICVSSSEVVFETGEIYSHADDASLLDIGKPYTLMWRKRPNLSIARLHVYLPSFWFPGQFGHLGAPMLEEMSQAINPSLASPAAEPPLSRVVRQSIERIIADDIERKNSAVGGAAVAPGLCPQDEVVISGNESVTKRVSSVSIEASCIARSASKQDARQPNSLDQDDQVKRNEARDSHLSPAQVNANEWLRAIATLSEYDSEITLLADGRVEFSRKALGFGAAPRDTYKLLYDAGYADQKTERSAIVKLSAAAIYSQARDNREKGGAV